MELEGRAEALKDAKCYPGGARPWDWTETGTSHGGGIQPADVEELLENGAAVVILSTGMNERLNVADETLQLLDARDIETHILPTEEAVERYNRLRTKRPVGILVHTTC